MPDQIRAKKVQDLVENGASSGYVPVAMQRMSRLAREINDELEHSDWLMGDSYRWQMRW